MTMLMDHVVLETREPERSVEFYGRILETEPVRLEEFKSGEAPFVSVRLGPETIIDFFPPAMWRDEAAQENPNHFCITTDEATARAVEDRLAASEIPLTKRRDKTFGAQGYGRSFYFDDPDGVSVEVRYYPESWD